MTTKVYDRLYYRYKIIDDVQTIADNSAIGKITVHKSKWILSPNSMYELTPYIRTPSNLEGMLQVQEFNPANEFVYYDSIKYVTEKIDMPDYTRDQLGLMDREELIEICRYLGIDYIHKPDKYLVKFILEKQKDKKIESKEEVSVSDKIKSEFIDPNLKINKKKKS